MNKIKISKKARELGYQIIPFSKIRAERMKDLEYRKIHEASAFESGGSNPTLGFLKKVVSGLGLSVTVK